MSISSHRPLIMSHALHYTIKNIASVYVVILSQKKKPQCPEILVLQWTHLKVSLTGNKIEKIYFTGYLYCLIFQYCD